MSNNGITRLERILNLLKGLSFGNVVVIFILVMTAAAIYTLYRFLNDEILMNKFLSHYEESSNDKIPCTSRIGSKRGGALTYSITTGFAYDGNDRWVIGIHRDAKISKDEFFEYCIALQMFVDYLHRPDAPSAIKGSTR